MIDIVFQLIIFFILTMTITQANLKAVQLPTAITALEPGEEEPLILHLYNDKQDIRNPHVEPPLDAWHITMPEDSNRYTEVYQLAPELTQKAAVHDRKHGVNEFGHSELEILVRGDLRAPSHYFAVILGACQLAKVYKIKVSIKPRLDA